MKPVFVGILAVSFAAFLAGGFVVRTAIADNVGVSIEVPCADCPVEVPQKGPGSTETRAGVLVEGYGPPGALLYILKDGAVTRTAGVPASGVFSESVGGLSPGATNIGVFAVDTQSATTPTITVNVVLYAANITRIFNLLLPPTIHFLGKQDILEPERSIVVRERERVTISGQTFPRVSVKVVRLPDRQSQEVLADYSGKWQVVFATDKLFGTYTVSARSFMSSGLLSEQSNSVFFTVIPLAGREPQPPREAGEAPPARPQGPVPPEIDLNGDRIVNLFDFSIFLYNWGAPKDPRIDYNKDGLVNLIDLSVLLYWWTG